MESPMHIDDNQLENEKVTLNVCIISNYTEQVEDTADFNILNPVLLKEKKEYSCLVCSSSYDCQSLCRKHIREKHMKDVTTVVLTRERAKEYSCPDTANNSISHITTPQKKKKVESPMHIDNNQLGTKKSSEVAGMMMNYNVPAQKSVDTEQMEDTDNSSKANTAALNILSPVPQTEEKRYICLVCSSLFDCRLLCREHIREKHVKNLTSIILRREKAKKNSCPDTANNPKLDSKKGMMLNYNGPAQTSGDTEQLEETDNSLKENGAIFNRLSPVLQMKKFDIKSLVVSDNGSVIVINLKEPEEENQMLTEK